MKTQEAECLKLLKSVMGNKHAGPFNEPVDYIALGVPDYPTIIKHPMDFGTIENQLSTGRFAGVEQFVADCRLVFSNAKLFNPPDHVVHKMASDLSKVFEKKWSSLEAKLDSKQGGKAATHNEPGRGNREWTRGCRRVLKAVYDHPDAYPFHQPVDWKKLGIPEYPKIVKRPMDLSKVEQRLSQMSYESPEQFIADMDLIFENAKTFNVEGSQIHDMAQNCHECFHTQCAGQLGISTAPKKDKKRKHREGEGGTYSNSVKTLLNQNLAKLRSNDLGKMVDLIRERCPDCIHQEQDDQIEIDVDQINPNDLEDISNFVAQSIEAY